MELLKYRLLEPCWKTLAKFDYYLLLEKFMYCLSNQSWTTKTADGNEISSDTDVKWRKSGVRVADLTLQLAFLARGKSAQNGVFTLTKFLVSVGSLAKHNGVRSYCKAPSGASGFRGLNSSKTNLLA